MAMARSKCACAFAASGSGDISAISPAVRWISASHHVSLVVSAAVIASPMQRQAASNCPSSAWARAKCGKKSGIRLVAPVVRRAVIQEIKISVASEALPVRASTQPWFVIPSAFQNSEPLSSAIATSSRASGVATARLPQRVYGIEAWHKAYISVAA
jgi:hypothetical protein